MRWLALFALLIPVPAVAQYAGMDSKVPWGTAGGTISWSGKVQENNATIYRAGTCAWDFQFTIDDKEIARSLHYKNTDTTYPFGLHNPPQLGDKKVEVVTEGGLTQPTYVNGHLTFQRNAQNIFFHYVGPTLQTTGNENEYAWDPARNRWQLQIASPLSVQTAFCGPTTIVNSLVQGTRLTGSYHGGATALRDPNLSLYPPNARLDYSWDLNLPSTAHAAPPMTQAPTPPNGAQGSLDCRGISARLEQQLAAAERIIDNCERSVAIQDIEETTGRQAMNCRRIANGLPPAGSDPGCGGPPYGRCPNQWGPRPPTPSCSTPGAVGGLGGLNGAPPPAAVGGGGAGYSDLPR